MPFADSEGILICYDDRGEGERLEGVSQFPTLEVPEETATACPHTNWLGGNGLEWFPAWIPVCTLLRCNQLCTLWHKQRNRQGEKGATVMELIEAADLDDVVIQEFERGLQGRILRAGDPDYDVARRHYNALINKHPALIVQCAGVADVIDAVNFARTHRVLVAVRGGGHNVAGRALVDGGMVIDLTPMKGIRVDPVRRTIQAQAGVTWGEFDR